MPTAWPAAFPPGTTCTVRLVDGSRHAGTVAAVADGWVVLETTRGPSHIAVDHVVAVTGRHGAAAAPAVDEATGEIVEPAGDAFTDGEIRALVEAFLDGRAPSAAARETGRPGAAVKRLYQAFEVARGNLVEDQVLPKARALIARVRSALTD